MSMVADLMIVDHVGPLHTTEHTAKEEDERAAAAVRQAGSEKCGEISGAR